MSQLSHGSPEVWIHSTKRSATALMDPLASGVPRNIGCYIGTLQYDKSGQIVMGLLDNPKIIVMSLLDNPKIISNGVAECG